MSHMHTHFLYWERARMLQPKTQQKPWRVNWGRLERQRQSREPEKAKEPYIGSDCSVSPTDWGFQHSEGLLKAFPLLQLLIPIPVYTKGRRLTPQAIECICLSFIRLQFHLDYLTHTWWYLPFCDCKELTLMLGDVSYFLLSTFLPPKPST